jgi:HEPN domain-containing protein
MKQLRTNYAIAALERLEDSRLLLEQGNYSGSIYFAGVATESMLKSFIVQKGNEIKGHNIAQLAVQANFARRLKTNTRDRVNAAVTEAALIWRNLFRYSSESDLDRMGLEWNLRIEVNNQQVRYAELGESRLIDWAERLYNLSALVVNEGDLLWRSRSS